MDWMDGFRLAWTGTCTVGSALGFYRVPTCIQYNRALFHPVCPNHQRLLMSREKTDISCKIPVGLF